MANDFSSDSHCLSVYNFESGALTTDSKGSVTLTASASAPTENTTDYKQGSCSADFESGSSQYYSVADADAGANWPGKNGTSNKVFSFTCWFMCESNPSNALLFAKNVSNKSCFEIGSSGTTLRARFAAAGGATWATTQNIATITTARWYFLAVCVQADARLRGRYHLWDDTAASWSRGYFAITNQMNMEDAGYNIGASANANPHDGEIDEVTIWDIFLSDADVDAIKAGTFSGTAAADLNTLYVDLVNGDDTKNGQTWATAAKTFVGLTGVAPGDTVRVAKSGDPDSDLGSITWTNNSNALTLNSALTYTITNCESTAGWTAEANAAVAQYTTYRFQGSAALTLTINAAFTTGRVAYLDLGAGGIDLSAYTHISLQLRNGSYAITMANCQIDLCDDQACTSVVDSFAIPAGTGTVASLTYTLVIPRTGGGNLGASIKGLRIYANSDPGNTSNAPMYIDNIIACTTAFNHRTLLCPGSDDGPWFTIQAIDGTAVTLGNPLAFHQDGYRYAGSTQAHTTYKRQPVGDLLVANSYPYRSGSYQNLITFKGGCNTSTGNQDGYTAIWNLTNTYGINTNAKSYLRYEQLIIAAADIMIGSTSLAATFMIEMYNVHAAGCRHCGYYSAYDWQGMVVDGDGTLYWTSMWRANAWGTIAFTSNYYGSGLVVKQAIDFWPGTVASSANTYSPIQICRLTDGIFEKQIRVHSNNTPVANMGIYIYDSRNVFISDLVIDYLTSGEYLLYLQNSSDIHIGRLELSAAGGTIPIAYIGTAAAGIRVDNFVDTAGATYSDPVYSGAPSNGVAGISDSMVFERFKADDRWIQYGKWGDFGDHVTMGQSAGWAYGGSGLSMVASPKYTDIPSIKELFVPVTADTTYTLKFQKIRTAGTPTLRILVFGAGITSFVADVTLTDSWAEYESGTFTPGYNGFITVVMMLKDGTTSGDVGIDEVKVVAS